MFAPKLLLLLSCEKKWAAHYNSLCDGKLWDVIERSYLTQVCNTRENILLCARAYETIRDSKFQAVYSYGCTHSANFILRNLLPIQGYNFLETPSVCLKGENSLIINKC